MVFGALAKNGSFGFAKGRLLGRLSDGSFVQSLYVYFCRSFLLCRLLGLQVTVTYMKRLALRSTFLSCYKYF